MRTISLHLFRILLPRCLARHKRQDSWRAGGNVAIFKDAFKPPFLLEHRSEDVKPNAGFTPNAGVSLSSDLAASGLLLVLPPDDLITLLLVLSKVTPSGGFIATPGLLAPHMGVSNGEMRRRLVRLSSLQWQGRPLASALQEESGLLFFRLSPFLFEMQSSAVVPVPSGQQARDVVPFDAPPLPVSRRKDAVALSRATYSRPRAEVESEITSFLSGENISGPGNKTEMGHHQPLEAETRDKEEATVSEVQASEARRWLALKKRLMAAGLSHPQAKAMLDSYPFECVQRQLDWLPHRHARNPIAYLLVAVAGDYAPPRSLIQLDEPQMDSPQMKASSYADEQQTSSIPEA